MKLPISVFAFVLVLSTVHPLASARNSPAEPRYGFDADLRKKIVDLRSMVHTLQEDLNKWGSNLRIRSELSAIDRDVFRFNAGVISRRLTPEHAREEVERIREEITRAENDVRLQAWQK